ncbi:hypothetical protein PUN28_001813 [Cardiocondyla obscurior]|uniref:Proteasome assembly chaperone 1 n=1 Tax=Cardiocondyla obscurior TaxID=286306 RepID=A0AAW2GRG8_9HYME
MASHFGEVIFPSSRAFWNDEEEYEPENSSEPSPKFYARWLKPKPEPMQKLIIIEGEPLIPLVERLYPKMKQMCVIENENHRNVSVIYQVDKEIYLCIILPQFDAKNAGQLVDQMHDLFLSSESTISIVCRHISQYQNTNVPEVPSLLRMLTTKTANVTNCKIKALEQPNIIFGVGAGVLSYAELKGIPSKLYILYIDSFTLDSTCAEPILQLLTDEIPCKIQRPTFTENPFSKGNLYM